MDTSESNWTNFQILQAIISYVLDDIYRSVKNPQLKKMLREALDQDDELALQEHLLTLQVAPVLDILLILDGAVGPDDWPGVDLVNAKTCESLSTDFGMDFATIKRQYLAAKMEPTDG
jgi:hypothetical protein